jgi:hypothetical protein
MQYSLNAGTTWTGIFARTANHNLGEDLVSIPTTQDLTQLQVRYCIDGTAGGKVMTLVGADIRTEGTIAGVQVNSPTATPNGGTYHTDQAVALADSTPGAAICYTKNGSQPTATVAGTCDSNGGVEFTYSAPFTVSGTGLIYMLGTLAGQTNSAVSNASFTLSPVNSVFSPSAGAVPFGTLVTVTNATVVTLPEVLTLKYTTNGTTPICTSSPTFPGGGLAVTTAETIKIAVCISGVTPGWTTGYDNAAYTIGTGQPSTAKPAAAIITDLIFPSLFR